MSKLVAFRDAIIALDKRSFYKYFGILLGVYFFIMGLLIYSHHTRAQHLRGRLKRVNQQRETVRSLLQKNEEVVQRQKEVDFILTQQPGFKIADYFETLLKNLTLKSNLNRGVEVAENALSNGYIEIKLAASFSGMNTKNICELLYAIKQNSRVYTKEIKLIKDQKTALLDVTLIIGTLEQQLVKGA